jgi:hypothetical protein
MSTPTNELLTLAQAMELTKRSASTLAVAAQTGRIPGVVQLHHRNQYPRTALLAWHKTAIQGGVRQGNGKATAGLPFRKCPQCSVCAHRPRGFCSIFNRGPLTVLTNDGTCQAFIPAKRAGARGGG